MLRHFFLSLPLKYIYFAAEDSGTPVATDRVVSKEKKEEVKKKEWPNRDPEVNTDRMSTDELKNDYKRLVRNLDTAGAEEMLSVLQARNDMEQREKSDLATLLDLTKQFKEQQATVLTEIHSLGTAFGNPVMILANTRKLHDTMMPFLKRIGGGITEPLEKNLNDLLIAAEQAKKINDNLNALVQLSDDYHGQKALTAREMLERWDGIKRNFEDINAKTKNLLPAYADVHIIATHLLEQNNPELTELAQYAIFIKSLEFFRKISEEITDMPSLQKRLARDYGMATITLEAGCVFEINEDLYKVMAVTPRSITMYPGKTFSPAELYMALLVVSGYESAMQDNKVAGEFIPLIEATADLEKMLGLDEKQHLDTDVELITGKDSQLFVNKVDSSRQKIHFRHSPHLSEDQATQVWKETTMSFQEFYVYWKREKIRYIGKPGEFKHSQSQSPISIIDKAGFKMPHLMSIAGLVQAVKWIRDSTQRMATERTEVDASNFSKKIAFYLDKLPWYHGIHNISETSNYNLVMEKIQKWIDQYQNGLKTPEFGREWDRFYSHNKIRQVALCAVAGMKGASEEEIYWKLGGSRGHRPTHNEYVQKVFDFFCQGPEALPRKVESTISKNISEGYVKEVGKGVGDTIWMADAEEILEMLRGHVGLYPDDLSRRYKWKRCRPWGDIQSLLKLGCNDRQLGIATLWNFKLIESNIQNTDGTLDQNTWSEELMRRTGNMGKAYVPMLGLMRLPQGMAIARSLIDFYRSVPGGGDPFVPNSEHEDIMGYIFAGKFEKAAREYGLEHKLGKDNFRRLHYLYLRARMFGLKLSTAASFGYEYDESKGYLDETTLRDAYGVGGMLSPTWLQTVFATETDGTRKLKYKDQTDNWWAGIEGDLKNVTEDERKLFAINFTNALLQQSDSGRKWYLTNRPKQIFTVLKYLRLPPGQTFQWKHNKDPNFHRASSIAEIEEQWKKKRAVDSSFTMVDISIPNEFEEATIAAISKTAQHFLAEKPDGNLDRLVGPSIKKYMEESKDYDRFERSTVEVTAEQIREATEQAKRISSQS